MQTGSLQLLVAGSFPKDCELIKVTTLWHSALLDNFLSLFPEGQTQYELGMCSKGSESAGKYTGYHWKLGSLCKPGVLTSYNLDSS